MAITKGIVPEDEYAFMNELQTVHAFVAALNDNDRKKFLASYGGGDDPYSTVLASLHNPNSERNARDVIEKLFG